MNFPYKIVLFLLIFQHLDRKVGCILFSQFQFLPITEIFNYMYFLLLLLLSFQKKNTKERKNIYRNFFFYLHLTSSCARVYNFNILRKTFPLKSTTTTNSIYDILSGSINVWCAFCFFFFFFFEKKKKPTNNNTNLF